MTTVATLVMARGGSTGIPHKNIRPLHGKPLIAYTFDAVAGCGGLDRVLLSTDCPDIAALGREHGIEVPFLRPSSLAQNHTHVIESTLHAVNWLKDQEEYVPDYFMLLQPTSPFRTSSDIEAAMSIALAKNADAVVSVMEADQNPHLFKTIDENGTLSSFIQTDLSESRRQDLPAPYVLNGAIYLVKTSVLLSTESWCPRGALACIMTREHSLDIDTEDDWLLAEQALSTDHSPHGPDSTVRPVNIGTRAVGPDNPCFIIAEAGVNHNGQLDTAISLVNAAADAGVDAIKFQSFSADNLVSRGTAKADYQTETTGDAETQLEMLQRLELSPDSYATLKEHAHKRGLVFLSTPFDHEQTDYLAQLGIPAFKVSSGDLTNLPLLAHIAAKQLPMIVSTGMSTIKEVESAMHTITAAGNGGVILLHCTSSYPAETADANLRAITTLASRFRVPVGYSDHTIGAETAVAAVALGACLVEKHLTMDRTLPGPDHRASSEPDDLRSYVRSIRIAEMALGDGLKHPMPSEVNLRASARRSLVAARDIPAHTRLSLSDIDIKRPGNGIQPGQLDKLIGMTTDKRIAADSVIRWDMLAELQPIAAAVPHGP